MGALKYLNKYFFKYRFRLILGVLFITASNIFGIFPAQMVRIAIDLVSENIAVYNYFNGAGIQSELYRLFATTLLFFGLLVIALALIKGMFMFFMRQTIIVMSRLIEYDLKNEIFEHYQKLSTSFYRKNNTGDLMARISEDVSRVRMYIGPAVMYTINLTVMFLLVVSTMLYVNVKLTLFVLLPLPFLSYSIYYVKSIINQRSDAIQSQLSTITSFVQEAFSGIRVLKAFGVEDLAYKEFDEQVGEYRKRSLSLAKVDAMFFPLTVSLIGLSTLITVYVGGKEVFAGNITVGNIAEFVIYVNMLTWPVASLGWVTSIIQRAAASQERINEFLKTAPEIVSSSIKTFEFAEEISFNQVSFKYDNSDAQALKDIHIKIKKGETLGVIGATGSGKTTLASLLTRIYDVNQGSITIDGRDIREVDLKEYLQIIGYVPQDVFLFSDSIKNNVAFGLKETPDAEELERLVLKAAAEAVVKDNIMEFPDGFDTMIGERGVTLSGGQKQRLSIARALIKSPQILIFDDCFSAVDTSTEAKILSNINKIIQDKTAIIISHRVSSVKGANQIIVLDNGGIIEQGTHDELVQQDGYYAEMYNKQLLEEQSVD